LVQKILVLNAAAAAGQVFIFLTITWYTPVITTTITTTRKFVTILLSVWAFGHSFSLTQWTAVALVFTGLYLVIAVQRQQHQQKTASGTTTGSSKAKTE
jgi:UDP-galactose transporter B1